MDIATPKKICIIKKEINRTELVISVFWYVNALLDFHFIQKARIDNHDIYFDSKLPLIEAKMYYFTKHDKCSQRIKYVKESNELGCTKTQLSKILRMHPTQLKNILTALKR